MRDLRFIAPPALALFAGLTFAPAKAQAETSILASLHEDQPVKVYVSFSTQVPLPDLKEATLSAMQKAGREYFYLLGREECTLLKATIAKICQLTDLNVSTQIMRRYYDAAQPMLDINGNATFAINLKDDAASLKDDATDGD